MEFNIYRYWLIEHLRNVDPVSFFVISDLTAIFMFLPISRHYSLDLNRSKCYCVSEYTGYL